MARDHARRGDAGADCGAADRPVDERRATCGARRASRRTMRAEAVPLSAPPAMCSTRAAPAATDRARSTSRPPRRIVVAACGVRVAKHGNRSVSSLCGSADVLEALGVTITAPPAIVERCLSRGRDRVLLRADLPPGDASRGARRARISGVRTAFNLLGPLTNPAGACATDRRRAATRADRADGARAAAARVRARVGGARRRRPRRVVDDRLHEGVGVPRRAPCRPSTCIRRNTDSPRAASTRCAAATRRRTRSAFARCSTATPGPTRDVVLLNAGAALFIAGRVDSVRAGIAEAAAAIDSGQRAAVLRRPGPKRRSARSGSHERGRRAARPARGHRRRDAALGWPRRSASRSRRSSGAPRADAQRRRRFAPRWPIAAAST